jgi:plastocyanin
MRTSKFLSAAVAVIALTAAGCSSDSSSDASSDASSEASADASTADTTAGVDTTGAATAGGMPVLANGEAPAERTISITSAGFSPTALTIAVGENVTFVSGDDGTYAVLVGGLDGATVTGGLIETFEFPEAGTYTVVEDISGATATITVA